MAFESSNWSPNQIKSHEEGNKRKNHLYSVSRNPFKKSTKDNSNPNKMNKTKHNIDSSITEFNGFISL